MVPIPKLVKAKAVEKGMFFIDFISLNIKVLT